MIRITSPWWKRTWIWLHIRYGDHPCEEGHSWELAEVLWRESAPGVTYDGIVENETEEQRVVCDVCELEGIRWEETEFPVDRDDD